MKTLIRLIVLSSLVLGFLSCDKDDDSDVAGRISDGLTYKTPNFALTQTEFSDNELLSATYTDYKSPNGFYHEDQEGAHLYYVNTISTDSTEKGRWIQLSTNSFEKAKYWSMKSANENYVLKDGVTSEKFFEFTQSKNPQDNFTTKFRTHKSSYLTRDNYDFFRRRNTIGIFRKPNFSVDEAKELIDYLWYIDNFNYAGEKILSSFATSKEDRVEVHHYKVHIMHGDFGLNDIITLVENVYSIERSTGVITVSERTIREIKGKYH